MGKEHLERLGEPFLQADRGINRKYDHQGNIHFESEPGIGTNVQILLPLDGPKANENNIVNLDQFTEKNSTPVNDRKNSNLANNRKVAL